MAQIRKFIPSVLLLIFLAVFIISFRTFIFDNIISPIALLFWAAWRIMVSVDQIVYWIAVIILCTILVVRLIPAEEDNPSKPVYKRAYKSPNRTKYLKSLVDEAVLGRNASENLRNDLKKLFENVQFQGKLSFSAADEDKKTVMKSLSIEAQHYLLGSGRKLFQNDQLNKYSLLPKWFRKLYKLHDQRQIKVINEILDQMEAELEIENEK